MTHNKPVIFLEQVVCWNRDQWRVGLRDWDHGYCRVLFEGGFWPALAHLWWCRVVASMEA